MEIICPHCDGSGCDVCGGDGNIEPFGTHGRTEAHAIASHTKLTELEDKIDNIEGKCNDIAEKVNEIKAIVDEL